MSLLSYLSERLIKSAFFLAHHPFAPVGLKLVVCMTMKQTHHILVEGFVIREKVSFSLSTIPRFGRVRLSCMAMNMNPTHIHDLSPVESDFQVPNFVRPPQAASQFVSSGRARNFYMEGHIT